MNPLEALGVPSGYQPSVKYCLMSARDPATSGVAMLVPRSTAMKQDGLFDCLSNTNVYYLKPSAVSLFEHVFAVTEV